MKTFQERYERDMEATHLESPHLQMASIYRVDTQPYLGTRTDEQQDPVPEQTKETGT